MNRILIYALIAVASSLTGFAQTKAPNTKKPAAKKVPAKPQKKAPAPIMPPTAADVPYGSHPKQVVDFYQAKSDKPTPCMLFIHGGGWMGGNKWSVSGLKECLAAGISVVSVEYRFVSDAHAAGIKPPVKWPLEDAARALQFVRSKATEWNIDKERIGASGGSAGACSSLFLAFRDDMADASSSDPVARESTRLWCAAVMGAQTTLDPKQMKEWTPNSVYGGHAFGFMNDPKNPKSREQQFALFLENREKIMDWIKAWSPYAHASAGDPPIYMNYRSAPALGKPEKDPTHSANFGLKLKEHCDSLNIPCELYYPGAPNAPHVAAHDYLIEKLKASK
ncbi:MAG: alpha/beta hydrolase [Verrucomicrobiaceae bacterium]|nr:alpha/beta hydrolase [Verrucomicrobiaceae bacterium]